MKKQHLMTIFFSVAIFLLPGNLTAQYQYNIASGWNTSNLGMQAALAGQKADTLREGFRAIGALKSNGTRRAGNTPAKNTVRGKTTFTNTGSLILPKLLAKKFSKTPDARRDTEANFVRAITTYENFLKNDGLASNDLARSATSIIKICLLVHSGNGLTQKQTDGVYRAFKDIYETDERLKSLRDLDKQKIYESNIVLWSVVFIKNFIAEDKRDQASRQVAKDYAEQVFEVFLGTSIKNVRLNPNGIEIN